MARARAEGYDPEAITILWWSLEGGGFCFHFLIIACAPNKKRCCTDTSEEAVMPLGSSKATMRDEYELVE